MLLMLLLFALNIGGIWVASKYLGKIGLYVFTLFNLTMAIFSNSLFGFADLFGASVCLEISFVVPALFGIFIMLKNYGIGETMKLTFVSLAIIIFASLIKFVAMLCQEIGFGNSLKFAIVPLIMQVLTLGLFVISLIVLLKATTLFSSLNDKIREFIIIAISLVLPMLLYVCFIYWTYSIAFGYIMLSFLFTYIFAIIFFAVLYFLENFIIKLSDTTILDAKIEKTSSNIINKTSSLLSKTFSINTKENENNKDE